MVLYPDNDNRASRVKDLANDIGFIQDAIKKLRDQMIDQEKETYLTLEKIATAANFPTVEAYVNHSIDLLPPDQKQKYLDLQDKVKAQGKGIDITLFTAGALGTIGILAKIGDTETFLMMVNQIRGYITQYRAMAQGIGDAAEGAADAGDLAQVAEVVGDAADVAEDGAEAGAAAAEETASLVGIAAKGLVVVGILATIGTIIFDGVEGAKQRDTCRQYTHELCGKRLVVQYYQLEINKTMMFQAKALAIIEMQHMLNGRVAKGRMSQADADQEIQDDINDLKEEFGKARLLALNSVSYDDAYNELQTMDSNSSTWIHEDPDLDTQKRWIKDNIKPIERSATGTADGAVKT